MKKADIKTGFLCNSNCRFCVQGDLKKALGNKSAAELKEIIKEASRDCGILVFTGGEVCVREDILELVAYARQFPFHTIQIQSNGRVFMDERFCADVISAGANEFALALHGHTPELHDYLTQSAGFKQTIRGIRNLKKLGQRVLVNTVVTKPNYRHLPDITKLLISLDVDQMQLAFVHALGSAALNFESMVPRLTLVMPYVIRSIVIARHFDRQIVTEAIPYCFLKGYEGHVSEQVMPIMKIFEHDHVVANFTESRLTEGKLKGLDCPQCAYYEACEGSWKEYPQAFGWDEFVPVSRER
jgi:MoaA/NifB/PqqE/SkfB family radical SAM enzyme